MTLDEMVQLFTLERIGPSPARFDHDKLTWLNGQYLQGAPAPRLLEQLRPFGLPDRDPAMLERALELHRQRAKTLVELSQALTIYGDDPRSYDEAGLKKFGRREMAGVLAKLIERLEAVRPYGHAGLEQATRAFATEVGMKLGDLAQPVRLALTGTLASPPLFELMEVLGAETSFRRLHAFTAHVGKAAHASTEETWTTPAS
jgi:glutamyl-tRNA synthetase